MVLLMQSGSPSLAMMRKQHIYRPNIDMVGSFPSWLTRRRRRSNAAGFSFSCSCLSTLCSPTNIQIIDIIHNKVLIAAAVSAAIGQCSKPFTSSILFGHPNLDIRNAFRAGGFPSTHSSAAVAAATTLGLERGLSDSIFGLAVVYACLIMYDAQGVRREVGSHAKVINKVLFRNKLDKDSCSGHDANKESFSGKLSSNWETKGLNSFQPRLGNASASSLLKSDANTQNMPLEVSSLLASDTRGGEAESIPFGFVPLKESIGHTEIEVIAGALLGFFVSLAVCTIL